MTGAPFGAPAMAIAILVSLTACAAPPAESPEPEPEVAVTVIPVVRATLHAYVEGFGRVEPEPATAGRPAANARVTSPVAGVITAILGAEGQRVARGATLFRLDDRVADIAVERARQAVAIAEQLVQRQEQLGPGQATSQKAYQEAAAQLTAAQGALAAVELQRRLLDVPAPITGTIVTLAARVGDAVDPSTNLAELIDLGRLVVSVSIRSVDAATVKRGQRMEVLSNAGAGQPAATSPLASAATTVGYIAAQVDSATDTVLVRGRTAAGAAVRPGQFVNVRIVTEERRDRLVVPVDSIVQVDGGHEVAVVDGDTAVKTRVTLGLREGGVVEVQGDGLTEGVSVVVQGAYGLPAKSKITVVGR